MFVHFLKKYCHEHDLEIPAVPAEIFESILEYDWKGNIRELENVVERLIVTSQQNVIDSLDALPQPGAADETESRPLPTLLQAYEDEILLEAVQRLGTTRRVARALGISQATAARKLRNLRQRTGRAN